MKILIATVRCPDNTEKFVSLCAVLRAVATQNDLIILPGIYWTSGKGTAFNVAFEVRGEDKKAEMLADTLTMHLFPARWTTTNDRLPRIDTIDCLPDYTPTTSEDLRKLAEEMRNTCPFCGFVDKGEGNENDTKDIDHAQGCPRYQAKGEV
jgi:hypothetical protein